MAGLDNLKLNFDGFPLEDVEVKWRLSKDFSDAEIKLQATGFVLFAGRCIGPPKQHTKYAVAEGVIDDTLDPL